MRLHFLQRVERDLNAMRIMAFRNRRHVKACGGHFVIKRISLSLFLFNYHISNTATAIRSLTNSTSSVSFQKIGRAGRIVCSLCDHHVMGSSSYVIVLGLIGTVSPS